ncbi:hypothetical protein ACFL50_00240 [Candidatus Latescibacterota bacterium]
MIKPPFTVLILKDSHDPVTLRFTKKMVLGLFLVFCAVTGFAVYGVLGLLPREYSELIIPDSDTAAEGKGYILPDNRDDGNISSADLSKPDVTDMSINEINENEIEFEFSFTRLTDTQNVYVWIIINPEADTIGEKIIHPRSPVFRGLPVDFRNGMHYNQMENDSVKAVFSGLKIGLDFTRFRVLAYSDEGKIVIDRLFNISKNIRL